MTAGRYLRIVALLLPGAAVGCQTAVHFPPADISTIAKIEASLETHERIINRFEIRPDDYGRVLRLFEGRTVDSSRATWVYAGNVSITFKDGRSCGIALYRTHQAIGAYKVEQAYYRGSTDEAIIGTIIACYERSAEGR